MGIIINHRTQDEASATVEQMLNGYGTINTRIALADLRNDGKGNVIVRKQARCLGDGAEDAVSLTLEDKEEGRLV